MPTMRQVLHGIAQSGPTTIQLLMQKKDFDLRQEQVDQQSLRIEQEGERIGLQGKQVEQEGKRLDLQGQQFNLEKDLQPSKKRLQESQADFYDVEVLKGKAGLKLGSDISDSEERAKSLMASIGAEMDKPVRNTENIFSLNRKLNAEIANGRTLQGHPGYSEVPRPYQDSVDEVRILAGLVDFSVKFLEPENQKEVARLSEAFSDDRASLSQVIAEISKAELTPSAKNAFRNVTSEIDHAANFAADVVKSNMKTNPIKGFDEWAVAVEKGEAYFAMDDVGWRGMFLQRGAELDIIAQDSRIAPYWHDPGPDATDQEKVDAIKIAGYISYNKRYFKAVTIDIKSYNDIGGKLYTQKLSESGDVPDEEKTFQAINYLKELGYGVERSYGEGGGF